MELKDLKKEAHFVADHIKESGYTPHDMRELAEFLLSFCIITDI